MDSHRRQPGRARWVRWVFPSLVVCAVISGAVRAQGLTGALIGTVRDEQGGVLVGARVRVSSPALIGGEQTITTNEAGQMRFPALSPGVYALAIDVNGFTPHRETGISIGAGATIERIVSMKVAGPADTVTVETKGSRIEARASGLEFRFGPDYFRMIPSRRYSMFDALKAAPGVSATSPSGGTTNTLSAFGSGTNENLFLIDGMNSTCPCNGVARSELGVDFIREVQGMSVGASAEFGNMQGAVFNVVTKQGSDRFLFDASYYGQRAPLTSQPVRLPVGDLGTEQTGYERARYHDLTANLGGPLRRDRLWFFAGYQHLRDYDSQPGTDPAFPREYEQDKVFLKLTWRLTPALQLSQSVHGEFWVNPDTPTRVTPIEATRRRSATVPAMTFGHLTHTWSSSTVWDVRVGRFVYDEERAPSTSDWTTPSRFDNVTKVTSSAPPQVGGIRLIRTTGKATLNHFRSRWLGADQQWKVGVEVERGEQQGANLIPTGVRFIDNAGRPFQAVSQAPSNTGGAFITTAGFASGAITVGDRLTMNLGVRFDHSRAISQDLHVLDAEGRETDDIVPGLGTMYTWNVWSPRLGITTKLTGDGRTMLRASYGRFSQGVLTGEITPFHPGVTPTRTTAFDPATGGYTRFVRELDPAKNLEYDAATRAPHTDEYSVGIDRELGRSLAVSLAYVHKRGADFIGWTDIGGEYREEARQLADGRTVPVFVLTNSTDDQRFRLTNIADYSLKYHGLVMTFEKRRSHGWQASGSYTFSRAVGLQASSGAIASGAQASTVAAPTLPFGRDRNDLTNAFGRLPNDRPHMFRLTSVADVPRTGIVVAASLQHFTGKPWAASAEIELAQGDRRILLEPRGSRRLSSQTLLDLRVSRTIRAGRSMSVELLVDVLNALNDAAEEGLETDDLLSPSFGRPTIFMDPRRAMLSVRFNLGR